LTFTRASGATRVASNGLIEKVRTNLVLQSQTFENASWQKYNATATANTTTAPDGTTTADTLTDNTANDIHVTYQSLSLTAGENTISVYAKANTLSHASIYIFDGANFFSSGIFNLSNGTVSGAGSIVSAGNGWYRVSFTATIASGSGNVYIALSNGSTISYAGTGQSIYVWGYQLETGDIATDYIPTTTAAVSVGPVSNVPRLDYLGSSCPRLLLEPQRTNLYLYSNDFSDVNWAKFESSVTSNAIISPDGTVNAWKLNDNTVNGQHALLRSLGGITSPTAISFFVKSAEYSKCCIENYSDGGRVVFDIATKTIVSTSANFTSATIQQYANGFIRISAITVGTTGNKAMGLGLVNDLGQDSFVGTGTKGIYVYGAQAEAGSYATSYIPTIAASVTRVADAASKTGISSLIGQTEGTLYAEFVYSGKFGSSTNASMPISIDDASGNNEAYIFVNGASNIASGQFVVGGGFTCNIAGLALTIGTNYKLAFAYKQNDFAFYINGVLQGVDTSGNIVALPNLRVGNYFGGNYIQDTIKQAILFKTRLTNAQLAELTSL